MKQLGLGLAVLAMSAASSVFAATGTITFNGEIVAGTCDPSVGGAASGTVTMLPANEGQLKTAADTAGATPFKITLKGAGCTAGTKIATPFFESESAKVNADGRLINTGAAEKVDIQLLNSTGAVIDLNKPAATQELSTGVDVGGDANDFNYQAQYYATDAAVAGTVVGSVSYSVFYK
ncbi:fimbrial protein [Acinetobacter calcoaceticus]|uniref:fimbrial protein n=1 Tax=Acinetobacter calcoaceticus TaxID=471 RepID=UPI00192A910F|nr:fimbrial protein [Acinetobacter calcoaceticus]